MRVSVIRMSAQAVNLAQFAHESRIVRYDVSFLYLFESGTLDPNGNTVLAANAKENASSLFCIFEAKCGVRLAGV